MPRRLAFDPGQQAIVVGGKRGRYLDGWGGWAEEFAVSTALSLAGGELPGARQKVSQPAEIAGFLL